jgi:alpha-glucoside transport system permease protein
MGTRFQGARRRFGDALFILPAGLLLVVFLIYPTALTFRMSLDKGDGLRLSEFVGMANFDRLFSDPLFIDFGNFSGAVFNNVLWLVLYVGGCLGLGLLIASLADRVRYERAIKAIVFAPQAIAATAAAVIWLLVYAPQPNVGLVNGTLGAIGVSPIGWLGQRETVNLAIIVAAVWAGTGLVVVILSAAIKSVPAELIEAATLDGATTFQTYRTVVIPMIAVPMSVIVVTLAISVIKLFDIVFVMTRGGPFGASRVIGYYYYAQTFEAGRGGLGAAAAVVMVLMMIPIMLMNIRRFRLEEEGS